MDRENSALKYYLPQRWPSTHFDFSNLTDNEFLPDYIREATFNEMGMDGRSLIVDEEKLAKLPTNWKDCVGALIVQNFNDTKRSYCPQWFLLTYKQTSAKLAEFLALERIKLFVNSPSGIWRLILENDHQTPKYIGGNDLVKFCNKNALEFYGSHEGSGIVVITNLKTKRPADEDKPDVGYLVHTL